MVGTRAGAPGLADVVDRVRPTMLIGTSTQVAALTEAIVRAMAAHTERPIILPLSNPTSKAEAVPQDLIRWTDGRALVATGSPFAPVHYGGRVYTIAQANNALVFPGLGLGVTVARARRITDAMLVAAAAAVARLSDATTRGSALLPPVEELRAVSAAVADSRRRRPAADRAGVAQRVLHDPVRQVHAAMWQREYPRIEVGHR
jgi:malate dehydrogenase (oxaloacetate-decarboxylating)